MRAILLNGPIRTGRGTCHERALRFGRREAPIRCGFARTYVPDGRLRVRRRTAPPSDVTITQAGEERQQFALREIGLAGVHDRRVREDVYEGRLPARERPLERRA